MTSSAQTGRTKSPLKRQLVLIPHREGMTTGKSRGVKAKTCAVKLFDSRKVGRCLCGTTRKPAWLRHSLKSHFLESTSTDFLPRFQSDSIYSGKGFPWNGFADCRCSVKPFFDEKRQKDRPTFFCIEIERMFPRRFESGTAFPVPRASFYAYSFRTWRTISAESPVRRNGVIRYNPSTQASTSRAVRKDSSSAIRPASSLSLPS